MHVTFEDVAVYFSEDEWRSLSQGQRELYKDVMRENLVNLMFLGLDIEIPDIFHQIEQWEKRGASNISKHKESRIVNENQTQKEVIGDRETTGEKRTLKDREPKCLLCRGVFKCYCSLAKTKRKKRFVCVDCGKGYSQEWYLIAHQKCHYRGQPYKCSLCDKSFKKPSHLKRHQKTHTVTVYKCSKCQAEFQESKDLKEHKAVHQQPKLCSTCGKTFLSFLELKLHMKEAHSKFFECSLCHQLFRYKTDLMNHQREHLVDEVYKCHKCDKVYTRLPYFLRHAEVHSKDEGRDGDLQPKSPPKEPEQESGSSAHTWDTKPLPNQQEHISLSAKEEASPHVVPPDPTKYQRRKFQRKECVSEEFLKESDVERLFRCRKCKKCFKHHSTLMRHHLSHSLVLVCHDCGQKFGKMLKLFMHRSKHKRRRPYKCKSCGKAFSVQSLLHLHQHTHSYSKPGHGRGRSSKRPQVPSTETSPNTRKSTASSPLLQQRSLKNQATKNPSNVCSQDNIRISPTAKKRPYPEVVACNYVKRVCYRPCESRYTV